MGFFDELGKVIGTVTGGILSIPIIVIAETLNITKEMVIEAKNAGCETYEEIKEFFELD
jgi:hypothetical protein